MLTPGNPLALLTLELDCPSCGNPGLSISPGAVCKQCRYKRPLTTDGLVGRGDQLGEYLEVLEVTKGGMSEVYICILKGHKGPKIAAKTFKKRLFFDRASREAFEREVINWMKLAGLPHIVPAADLMLFGDRPFVLMPAFDPDELGRLTLRDFLSQGQLTGGRIFKYAFEIAEAMQMAQTTLPGLIHGDLKPENIFIYSDSVFITDFGLSRLANQSQHLHSLESTYSYRAPECWSTGDSQSPSVDVYAFGIILYEMLVGKQPFAAANREQWLEAHNQIVPQFSKDLRESEMAGLVELAIACLKKRPEDRPADFAAVLKHIIEFGLILDPLMLAILLSRIADYDEHHQAAIVPNPFRSFEALLRIGKYDLALRELEGIQETSYNAHAWSMRSLALSELERDSEALVCIEKALAFELTDERKYPLLIEYGLLLKRLRRIDEADRLFEELLSKIPDDLLPRLVVNFATVYIESGRPTEAIELLLPFVRRHPGVREGWANLGQAYAKLGDYEHAVEHLNKALAVSPSFVNARMILANILYFNLEQIENALAALEPAYGQGYQSPLLFTRLIECYSRLGNFAQAQEKLAEFRSLFGDQHYISAVAAEYYRDAGDYANAFKEIERSISRAPDRADYLALKASIHDEQGTYEEAARWFRAALELDPEYGNAAEQLVATLLNLNRLEEAREVGRTAKRLGKLRPELEQLLTFDGHDRTKQNLPEHPDIHHAPEILEMRASLYFRACPAFDVVAALLAPLQSPLVGKGEMPDAVRLFSLLESRLTQARKCPLPAFVAGLESCFAGRFDLAFTLWQEAGKTWPYVPDFLLGQGYVLKYMFDTQGSDGSIEAARRAGLDLRDKRSLQSVNSYLPCCDDLKQERPK